MATTIQAIANSDTPFAKKFLVNGGGLGQDAEGVFTIDDFALALHMGPLKDALLGASPLDIDHFNIDGVRGNEIRIYHVGSSYADQIFNMFFPSKIYWKQGATTAIAGLACLLPGSEGSANSCIIEIRFNHSTQA